MFAENKEESKVKKGNLKISGSGSSAGGNFDEVRISGSGEVTGDVECNVMRTSGTAKIQGNVKAKDISTSGVCKINGSVETEVMKTSGSSEVTGDVTSKDFGTSGSSKVTGNLKTHTMHTSGSTNIGGSVHAEEIKISGSVNIGTDCEAERFKTSGGFKIGGLLNSGEIEVSVGGECRAKEIGGERIKITRSGRHAGSLERIIRAIFLTRGELTTDVIEGDEILLEATRAKIVRGNNITIGEECEIDLVEYTGKLNIIDGAKVKEQKKV